MRNVLLLGDSIRVGYCSYVRENLKDIANVYYPDDNCRFTQYTLVNLHKWLAMVQNPEEIDIIHWNNGQWDVTHFDNDESSLNSIAQYEAMLRRICLRLQEKAPKARIVFATTTPMNPSGLQSSNYRTTEEIIRYNEAAVHVMKELGIEINDLFALLKDKPASYYIDHCHLTQEGYQLLADQVSSVIRTVLDGMM